MSEANPLDGLIHLAQAAAEAGKDWQNLLRAQWIPEWTRRYPRAALLEALGEWGIAASSPGEDVATALESAVLAALDEAGYR